MKAISIVAPLMLISCIPQGSGPLPDGVYKISSANYEATDLFEPIEAIGSVVDSKINKKEDDFSPGILWENAYWYPKDGSFIYGVALVQYRGDLSGGFFNNEIYIEVYDTEESCTLCSLVESALNEHRIEYSSVCKTAENLSEYDQSRCGA